MSKQRTSKDFLEHGLRFIHLRVPIVTTDLAGYHHDDLSPKGGATIAYRVRPADQEGYPPLVDYRIAVCNPRDHYNRKLGRLIAGGRFLKYGPIVSFYGSSLEGEAGSYVTLVLSHARSLGLVGDDLVRS